MTDAGSIIQGLRAPPGEFRTIQSGDIAIIYERFDSMKAITIDVAGRIHNRYGLFDMKVRVCQCFRVACLCNLTSEFVVLPSYWHILKYISHIQMDSRTGLANHTAPSLPPTQGMDSFMS